MFKNECDFNEAKVTWILKCADYLKSELMWNGLNLRPALIRHLNLELHSVGRKWFEEKLFAQMDFKEILLELDRFEKTWKSKGKKIPGLLSTQYKLKWLGHSLDKNKKKKPLIVARHWKHVSYLKGSKLFDELDPNWLVDSPHMAKDLGLSVDDVIVPHIRPFSVSKSNYPLNELHDLANGLKLSLEKIIPSAIFVVEGDATYQSLLAEIGYNLNIPVY